MRIGVDFDNTIASYDVAMHRHAMECGLIDSTVPPNKRLIRDAIRALDDGESKWRALQVFCYGPGMQEAEPMPGIKEFFVECKVRRIPVWIVSHKTREANFGPPNVRLRKAAMAWLEEQGFLESPAFGIERERVFFAETRQAKIDRIRALDLTHFVDDLEETFLEPSFPPHIARILLSVNSDGCGGGWRRFASWPDIQRDLFGG